MRSTSLKVYQMSLSSFHFQIPPVYGELSIQSQMALLPYQRYNTALAGWVSQKSYLGEICSSFESAIAFEVNGDQFVLGHSDLDDDMGCILTSLVSSCLCSTASCCVSHACNCCGKAVATPAVAKSVATRVVYALQLLLFALLAWVFNNLPHWTHDSWVMQHIPCMTQFEGLTRGVFTPFL